MREDRISGKVECVKMVTNRDIRFFFNRFEFTAQKMHSSESLDNNLEECSEGLVEEYSSSDKDLHWMIILKQKGMGIFLGSLIYWKSTTPH